MSNDKSLNITIDRVRKAAAECGDAARVLKTLFPEVFAVQQFRSGARIRHRMTGREGIVVHPDIAAIHAKAYNGDPDAQRFISTDDGQSYTIHTDKGYEEYEVVSEPKC